MKEDRMLYWDYLITGSAVVTIRRKEVYIRILVMISKYCHVIDTGFVAILNTDRTS